MINRKLIYTFSLIAIIISCSACNRNKVLSRNKMIEVLTDIQLAEAVLQNSRDIYQTNAKKDALIKGVLDKHDITQAQLDSSLVWYSDNVEVYTRVNDSIIAHLKRETEIQSQLSYNSRLGGRTVNNSMIPGFAYLTETAPTLAFSIDSFQILRYPAFALEFNTLGIQQYTEADFAVSFTYADTVLTEIKKLAANTFYKIEKPNNSQRLKSISTYIHANPDKILNQNILLYNIVLTDTVKVSPIDTTLVNR